MKSGMRALAAIALIGASGAWAVAKGGTLYIKSKDTKVLKDPKAPRLPPPLMHVRSTLLLKRTTRTRSAPA